MPNKLIVGTNDFYSWCKKNKKEYLLDEWDYSRNGGHTPLNTMCGSSYKAWWVCSQNHSYRSVMYNRAKELPSGCPICDNRQVLKGYNDLATTDPELAKEWHPMKNGDLTPYDVTRGMTKKVWWFLPYDDPDTGKHFDFEWQANINNRASKGSGCPFLMGRVWTGYNDLSSCNPEVAEDWNYEKNGMDSSEISRNDNRKFWWKCKKCGYEWRASVNNRNSNNRGCPNCSKEKQRISYRNSKIDSNGSLADVNPELAKEWHPTKNGELTPYNVTSG